MHNGPHTTALGVAQLTILIITVEAEASDSAVDFPTAVAVVVLLADLVVTDPPLVALLVGTARHPTATAPSANTTEARVVGSKVESTSGRGTSVCHVSSFIFVFSYSMHQVFKDKVVYWGKISYCNSKTR